MQEQIDGLAVGDALVGREADRIDAEEGGLVGRTQQRLQARDHAWAPHLGGLERCETLLELFSSIIRPCCRPVCGCKTHDSMGRSRLA